MIARSQPGKGRAFSGYERLKHSIWKTAMTRFCCTSCSVPGGGVGPVKEQTPSSLMKTSWRNDTTVSGRWTDRVTNSSLPFEWQGGEKDEAAQENDDRTGRYGQRTGDDDTPDRTETTDKRAQKRIGV